MLSKRLSSPRVERSSVPPPSNERYPNCPTSDPRLPLLTRVPPGRAMRMDIMTSLQCGILDTCSLRCVLSVQDMHSHCNAYNFLV